MKKITDKLTKKTLSSNATQNIIISNINEKIPSRFKLQQIFITSFTLTVIFSELLLDHPTDLFG